MANNAVSAYEVQNLKRTFKQQGNSKIKSNRRKSKPSTDTKDSKYINVPLHGKRTIKSRSRNKDKLSHFINDDGGRARKSSKKVKRKLAFEKKELHPVGTTALSSTDTWKHKQSDTRKSNKHISVTEYGKEILTPLSGNEGDLSQFADINAFKRANKRKKVIAIKSSSEDEEEAPQLVSMVATSSLTNGKSNKNVFEEDLEDNDATDSLSTSLNLLSWVLAPITPSDFFDQYWETKPLCVKRTVANYYKHLLSSKKIDNILRHNALYYTRNVDVVSYENGKRETHNPEGRAVPSAVWDYYQNGCSVRILNPQSYCRKVQLLLATLQECFGTMVGANVYLTPPGSQGFAPHYDDIEAFVLQLEGRKHWKLYSPKNKNEVLARNSSHNLDRNELGDLLQEVSLEAGSFLYFPRGTIHEAHTDADSHSLHLTVSVYQHTAYADLLEKILPEALKKAAENDVEFRKGLPLQYLSTAGVANVRKTKTRELIMASVHNLLSKLNNYVDVDMGVDQMGRKFMYDAVPPVLSDKEKALTVNGGGEFLADGKVFNRVEFDPTTEVRLLRYHCIRLVVEGGQARIYYCSENSRTYHDEEEQFLEIDMSVIPAVCTLINKFPLFTSIETLPIEDGALKIQVVSDLWERGILITKQPLIGEDDMDVS